MKPNNPNNKHKLQRQPLIQDRQDLLKEEAGRDLSFTPLCPIDDQTGTSVTPNHPNEVEKEKKMHNHVSLAAVKNNAEVATEVGSTQNQSVKTLETVDVISGAPVISTFGYFQGVPAAAIFVGQEREPIILTLQDIIAVIIRCMQQSRYAEAEVSGPAPRNWYIRSGAGPSVMSVGLLIRQEQHFVQISASDPKIRIALELGYFMEVARRLEK